jgi:hypothetical protein
VTVAWIARERPAMTSSERRWSRMNERVSRECYFQSQIRDHLFRHAPVTFSLIWHFSLVLNDHTVFSTRKRFTKKARESVILTSP